MSRKSAAQAVPGDLLLEHFHKGAALGIALAAFDVPNYRAGYRAVRFLARPAWDSGALLWSDCTSRWIYAQ